MVDQMEDDRRTNMITFVIPSRNNLSFLKLAYKSIMALKGNNKILVLNDASEDGTQEWLDSLDDENLIVYINDGPDRVVKKVRR